MIGNDNTPFLSSLYLGIELKAALMNIRMLTKHQMIMCNVKGFARTDKPTEFSPDSAA